MKYDAFISYRRQTSVFMARTIYHELNDRGVNCFFDFEYATAGKFDERLISAIDSSKNFILVLSKGALDRCVNEDDWVRREILTAIKMGKKIIPVCYNDFKWPEKLKDKIPKEIYDLKYSQQVEFNNTYFPYSIDRIIQFMDNVTTKLPTGSVDFLTECMKSQDIETIDMIFHGGADWFTNGAKTRILNEIIERGIKLRVILNPTNVAEPICKHMRQPLAKYADLDLCVKYWEELKDNYPNIVSVKRSPTPILHRMCIFRNSDGSGAVNVKYYIYGESRSSNDCRQSFSCKNKEYELFVNEFDYLWTIK